MAKLIYKLVTKGNLVLKTGKFSLWRWLTWAILDYLEILFVFAIRWKREMNFFSMLKIQNIEISIVSITPSSIRIFRVDI